jgi:ubiquinone/menaquinone biosynthesis C-methylase UbiE
VRYLRSDIETLQLSAASADRVISSLTMHYVSDYRGLIHRIAGWLRPGGQLVFSIEHPICTAASPMSGWQSVEGTTVWPVDSYADETTRTQQWLGRTVRKHHRRLTTLISGVLEADLVLTGLDEPWPSDETIARHPDLAQHSRRPPLLLLAAAKPTAGVRVAP